MGRILLELWLPLRQFVETFGALQLFLLRLLVYSPRALVLRFRLIVHEVHDAGANSLAIILTCGLFVGMVLGLQGFDTLEQFGAEEVLGAATALSLLKELGPVLTALLFAGRAGTALASEIGLMRATDQLSAMELMAVDPVRRVVVPRFLGGAISVPLLTLIFNMVAIFGAYIIGVSFMGVDSGAFWSQMQENVEVADVMEGVVKSAAFGVAASVLAVFEGYNAFPTAEGVSRATTRTVVISSIVILVLDFLLTAILL